MTIWEAIDRATSEYRKGDAVTTSETAGVEVTEVFAMPHVDQAPDDVELVDLHFLQVGVNRVQAEAVRETIEQWCDEHQRMTEGPSYIEVGGMLDDQGYALRLFAVGQVLGLWKVVTPKQLGLTGDAAHQAAGVGYVMTTGYRKAGVATA